MSSTGTNKVLKSAHELQFYYLFVLGFYVVYVTSISFSVVFLFCVKRDLCFSGLKMCVTSFVCSIRRSYNKTWRRKELTRG